jgi:hypothetical protein
LTFAYDEVLRRAQERGDEFAPALSAAQRLPSMR